MARIGVAVSTHARPRILAKALKMWGYAMPDILVVNHDRDGAGVAATKNAGLAALMDAGCDYLVLADDDVWPITEEWWRPYVDNDQPALCHCWGKSRFIGTDRDCTVWKWPKGVLQVLTREVVERVGGMRTEFRNAGEHADLFRRIHNAGFTRHPFQDALAAREGVWHCLDYTRQVPSSLPTSRYGPEETARRHELYDVYRHSAEFVEFRG